jgi:hypothetical protein
MKLEISNGAVKPVSLFKFVALGYGLGAGVIFVPLSIIVAIASLSGADIRWFGAQELLLAPVLVPFILGMQALMLAALVTVGLWIYCSWRRIEAVEV